MNNIIETGGHLESWLAENIPPDLLLTPLSEATANEVVDRLKSEADRYWAINPNRSLDLADRIIAIGKARGDTRHVALGLMARGDAIKFLGRMQEAWEMLEQAGNEFQIAGDEVGWARTRIGRLYLAVKLNRVAETLADGEIAQKILNSHNEYEKLLRLNINMAVVYVSLGNEHDGLRLYHSALMTAESLGESGQQHFGLLYMNMGVAHEVLGDFPQALAYYDRARDFYIARNESRNLAINELNIAYIAQARGHYRQALHLLYGILERGIEQFPLEHLAVKRDMIECYLYLNRYTEARDLAQQVINDYQGFGAAYETARCLLHLATAEAELQNLIAAQAALGEAEPIFRSLGATSWVSTTRLRRGRISLKQGDVSAAYKEAVAAATCFDLSGQQINFATATLLKGQALFELRNLDEAEAAGLSTFHIARRCNVSSLRYTAHMLLGKIAEAHGSSARAVRRFQAAAATIERVQSGLTITLRSGFLEDKSEPLHALIALHLRGEQAGMAFEALERAKSQVLLGYLVNRDHLRWAASDAQSQVLLEELSHLREEHQWFYRLAHEPPRRADRPSAVSPEQALAEVTIRERRMRMITEQLYLHSGHGRKVDRVPTTLLADIQCVLSEKTLLIEFYNDGLQVWAFVLDEESLSVHCLPMKTEALNQLLAQLQANMAAVLQMDPQASAARNLSALAQRILQKLYQMLIQPLALNRQQRSRLMIVPYGALHYLPFHLLHNGSRYLIEEYEVVILPAAGLATRSVPERKPGALILAHSWDGRLPQTLAEAQMVHQLFGGMLYADEVADRRTLQAVPTQILHIAAHGQHRLDQPDLSYLQLADGQLYTDDLLQEDLGYELVTLSACETGRANVLASDELIGLGRGFLYAGAGALLVSLWRVADDSTMCFMERMYRALHRGVSKAAAVRKAQQSILAENRQIHPAFWGAFQLIGDASPLSKHPV
jgi:CHAT domain-containing protein